MQPINFREEPPLWAEQYTDLFNFEIKTDSELLKQAVGKSVETFETGTDYYKLENGCIAVDNQLLVDELKEQLYGFEIVYRHTHIPQFYGKE